MPPTARDAGPLVASQHAEALRSHPFDDEQDFEDAHRGFIAALRPDRSAPTTGASSGTTTRSTFLQGEAPRHRATRACGASPGWSRPQGLFEVVEGIYQVRGLDLSNITFVEGDTGVIVIDPLISTETAAAALALYREHRGDRPVTGVIYTHSHVDHFGGVKGVVNQDDVDAGRVPVIAPEGFLEHAVAENVYAGTAMIAACRLHVRRRAAARSARAGRRRPRPDDVDRHRDPDRRRPTTSPPPARRRSSTGSGSSSR